MWLLHYRVKYYCKQIRKSGPSYVDWRSTVLLKYEELAGDVTAASKNLKNDRLYVPAAVRKKDVAAKRLLHTQSTFSQSLMVSVGVSKLGRWFDIRRAWSESEWSLLPHAAGHTSHRRRILRISAGQCSGAPGLWVELEREIPGFISSDLWPPNGPDLNPIDYQIWGILRKTILPDESAERGRFETAFHWPVERNGTRRYWRRHWSVAQSSPCMYSGQRRTLWIFTVTC